MNNITAYPLFWPIGLPKTQNKQKSKFSTGLSGALKNVTRSLEMFGKESGNKTENIVISSNVTLGKDNPADSGVAVWFVWEKQQLCIAVDRYSKVEDNLQAIHHIIEARRTELRHGGLHIVRQTFAGFKSLPEKSAVKNWWEVLRCDEHANEENVKAFYRDAARKYHPDNKTTGDAEKFREAQAAWETAEKHFRNKVTAN